MRFFDDDSIGCYLDAITHRVEKTKDGAEVKMVKMTLRVQPLTPECAVSLDPDVRAMLFNLGDAKPKAKIKAMRFLLTVPHQRLFVKVIPEVEGEYLLTDVAITDVRARTEKGVDGYALVFYANYGPASARDLEYICDWLTQQRFVTFQEEAPALNFEEAEPASEPAPPRRRRRGPGPIEAGDVLRPGVEAQH